MQNLFDATNQAKSNGQCMIVIHIWMDKGQASSRAIIYLRSRNTSLPEFSLDNYEKLDIYED